MTLFNIQNISNGILKSQILYLDKSLEINFSLLKNDIFWENLIEREKFLN